MNKSAFNVIEIQIWLYTIAGDVEPEMKELQQRKEGLALNCTRLVNIKSH